jgi:hypothetical protein
MLLATLAAGLVVFITLFVCYSGTPVGLVAVFTTFLCAHDLLAPVAAVVLETLVVTMHFLRIFASLR